MASVNITFPDGSKKNFDAGITPLAIAQDISEGLAKNCIAAQIDDRLVDTTTPITTDCQITLITPKDEKGLAVIRHSCAHLLAAAVKKLYPKAIPTIGPAIENGFYYDFDELEISEEDLPKIEEEMKKLAKEKTPVKRIDHKSIEDAKHTYHDNPYKLEIISMNEEGVSSYAQGDFSDLCRGPHVPNTGFIEAFKLHKVAKAYWRGKAENKQLTRIYGYCFAKKQELESFVKMMEEAEKRDHRKVGRDLDLIMFHEFSPGAPFFLAKGTVIFNELQKLMREQYYKRGYDEVITPLLYDKQLWETSGHWQHYKDNMFLLKIEERDFSLKPMNCPSHILIYKNTTRSYRDLPIRIADFAPLHRNEASGALSGMTRVRKFEQDDAHIFCTGEQIGDELRGVIDFVKFIFDEVFKMPYHVLLSTRPEDYMGELELWNKAEYTLQSVLEEQKMSYQINEGDGAFYGPKIDFQIRDAIGRYHQLATIQVDFQLPLRFEATYEGADGTKHTPVMIHRAILGSLERFMGVMIEHFGGKFPLWLSPEQIRVLPIADRHNEYSQSVVASLKDAGIRATLDDRALTTNKKVREAELDRVNYIIVVGDKELEAKTVNIRTRENQILGEKSLDDFKQELLVEIKERRL